MTSHSQNKAIQPYQAYQVYTIEEPVSQSIAQCVSLFVSKHKFYPGRAFVNTDVLRNGIQAPIGLTLKPDDKIQTHEIWFEVGR